MKKIYVIVTAFFVCAAVSAQIGASWWQMLPDDYATNPYARQEVSIQIVEADFFDTALTLEDVWSGLDAGIVVNGAPTNADKWGFTGASDLTADAKFFADQDYIYTIVKVIDDEIVRIPNEAGDIIPSGKGDVFELAIAPYGGKFDPGYTVLPAKDPYSFGDKNIPGATYLDMAYYGSWSNVGAAKVEIALASYEVLTPGTPKYTLTENEQGVKVLGDVSMGNVTGAFYSIYEGFTGGYYLLFAYDVMTFDPGLNFEVANGNQISIAAKIADFDNDNGKNEKEEIQRNDVWIGTTNNDAYWATAFYGAVGTFTDLVSAKGVSSSAKLNAYLVHDMLTFNRESIGKVEVFNVAGAKVLSAQNIGNSVNVGNLVKGVYLAKVTEVNGNVKAVKFVK